ncbi:hypothetical protein GCM10027265_27510 [Jatrophihabitans fulvus]
MERLTVLDAAFLGLETPSTPLHLGAVGVFGGTAPTRTELAARHARLLRQAPRYGMRLRRPAFGLARPV